MRHEGKGDREWTIDRKGKQKEVYIPGGCPLTAVAMSFLPIVNPCIGVLYGEDDDGLCSHAILTLHQGPVTDMASTAQGFFGHGGQSDCASMVDHDHPINL